MRARLSSTVNLPFQGSSLLQLSHFPHLPLPSSTSLPPSPPLWHESPAPLCHLLRSFLLLLLLHLFISILLLFFISRMVRVKNVLKSVYFHGALLASTMLGSTFVIFPCIGMYYINHRLYRIWADSFAASWFLFPAVTTLLSSPFSLPSSPSRLTLTLTSFSLSSLLFSCSLALCLFETVVQFRFLANFLVKIGNHG